MVGAMRIEARGAEDGEYRGVRTATRTRRGVEGAAVAHAPVLERAARLEPDPRPAAAARSHAGLGVRTQRREIQTYD